uniref:Uncharacterized protein n=1 Tax=Rhinolophus ferrumequinum TaxID=59479 RepID=A0A671EJW9_RHIFE
MAALCRTRAMTAESHFLGVFLVSRPCRGAGTESGSGSESAESTASGTRPGGFASALERHFDLQRKAELRRMKVSRGRCAGDAVGGAGSRGSAGGLGGGAGSLRGTVAGAGSGWGGAWCLG